MLNFIVNVLCCFESCFSRKTAFNWFVTIDIGHPLSGCMLASVSAASHMVQMAEDAYQAALALGDSLLLPDRYFLTVPALENVHAGMPTWLVARGNQWLFGKAISSPLSFDNT